MKSTKDLRIEQRRKGLEEAKAVLRDSHHYQMMFFGEALHDLWDAIVEAFGCMPKYRRRVEDILGDEVKFLLNPSLLPDRRENPGRRSTDKGE